MSDPIIEAALTAAIAEQEGWSATVPLESEQEQFRSGFSVAALVFGPIYFITMQDQLFTWLSVSSAVLFPLIVILPVFARRRSWNSRQWQGFNQYVAVQKKWDRAGVWALAVVVIVGFLLWNRVISPLLVSHGTDLFQVQKDLQELQ